ncbi:uncharacterized protein LOC135372417 [Ornithodoros turicata]|uniref:uncharacterized protein LOC135372417 n=1 Tax=Ornithodoros turicata TaxID=34597 RepID=UPI0031386DE4
MDPRSKRKKGSYCCVVGCHNNRADARGKQPAIKFYSFPNKWYEQERRRRWITAVRRVNEDGTDWEPSPTSVICSSHFVGNEKAVDEAHPAYVPTVFPEVYKKKSARPVDVIERYERSKKRTHSDGNTNATRHMEIPVATTDMNSSWLHIEDMIDCDVEHGLISTGTQTEATSQCDVGTFSVLMCTILDNAGSTQLMK